jgi:hypothetical protein
MEHEGSLQCSQEPSTSPYIEPDQSNPYHPILSLVRSILHYSPTYVLDILLGSFLLAFPPGIPLLPIRSTWSAHPILLDLIILIILGKEYKLWRS